MNDTSTVPAGYLRPRARAATGRRLVFVIDRLAGRGGGAERVLIETANALAARGHLVEIITHERSRDTPFYPLAPGVMLTRLRPPRPYWRAPFDRIRGPIERHGHHLPGLAHLAWLSRHGGFWRRLARYLEVTRPDAVCAFLPPSITALAYATERLRARGVMIPVLASTHNAPEQDFTNPERWGPGRLDRARRHAALDRMDRIAVLLPDYVAWHGPERADRVVVVPNAITPVAPTARARPDTSRIVLSVGRLAAVKRHDLLIAAWAELVHAFPDWQLHIYGYGPLDHELFGRIHQAGLEHCIRLMGESRDIQKAYRTGAFLAHPAAYEGFPLAVCEALAAGLPVMGFADCSGTNALVRDGETGLLLPGGDRAARVAALADGLKQLMSDPDARVAMGKRAPESMRAYAPGTIMAQWETLLLGLGDEVRT